MNKNETKNNKQTTTVRAQANQANTEHRQTTANQAGKPET